MACFSKHKTESLKILEEGELIASQRDLCERWGWGRQKVREFLSKLEKDSMILQFTTMSATKITICNYSRFQSNGTNTSTIKQPSNNPAATQQQPTLIYNKNDKNEEECIVIGQINFKLSFVEEKKKLFPMLDVVGEVRKCVNWHSSKGRKIKDWNRAVSNWLSIAYDRSGTTGTGGTGGGYQRFIKYRTHAQ